MSIGEESPDAGAPSEIDSLLDELLPSPDEPAADARPPAIEEPVVDALPPSPDEPAVFEPPPAPDGPAVFEQPLAVEEPVADALPPAVEEPAVFEPPPAPDEPAVDEAGQWFGSGMEGWEVTPVAESQIHTPEPQHEPELPAVVPPPSSGRRVGALAIGALVAVTVIGAAAGYWFGARQDGQAGTPETAAGGAASTVDSSVPNASESTDQATATTSAASSTVAGPASTADAQAAAQALQSALTTFDTSPIDFAPGTDNLTTDGRASVTALAAILIAHPTVPAEVELATFTESAADLNRARSVARADVIVDALVADGVAAERVVAVGLGSSAVSSSGGSALLFDTDDPELSAELSRIDVTAMALDANDGLSPGLAANLDLVAEAMARHPEQNLTLLGYVYADTAESSHDRAHVLVDAAAEYLGTQGVDGSRLEAVGMGDASLGDELGNRARIQVGTPAELSLAVRNVDTDLITFEPGTDELTPESLPVLSEVAAALAIDPASVIEVSLHTYTEDSTDENHDLSHLQGDAVAAALVEAGVAPGRLEVVGYGDLPEFARSGKEAYVRFSAVG